MSGIGHTTTTITASGEAHIDGILYSVTWNDGTIFYSFPTDASEYGVDYPGGVPDGFIAATNHMERATQFALDTSYGIAANDGFSIEGFTNLDIQLTTNPDAHIRVARTTEDPYSTGTSWSLGPVAGEQDSGDVWFTNQVPGLYFPNPGNYAHHSMLYNLAGTLGLRNGSFEDPFNGFGKLPTQYDAMEYSVVVSRSYVGASTASYTNETWGYAQTWMMMDIAALQYLYGADFTTNSSNTTYSWDPVSGDTLVDSMVGVDAGANRIFATIWDGGGVDTYDLSAYSTDLQIDLAPGGASLFSTAQLAALGNGNFATGNIYNALQYQGDSRSLIENATGGSGNDVISGNTANNLLRGNGGDDQLFGILGDDRLFGHGGNDVLNGGRGADMLLGGSGIDDLRGGDDNDILNGGSADDRLFGGNGDDVAYGGGGNDRISGGEGNDELFGQNGQDTILGVGGDDILVGGLGKDIMHGGSGMDTFRFNDATESPSPNQSDRIMDFEVGVDTIDLSNMAAGFTIAIGGSFSEIGPSVITNETTNNTIVLADVDGDGNADFRAVVVNTLGLAAGDFDL